MGLLNLNQLLPGARKAGNYVGSKTYALAGLVDLPTTSVTGDTISLGTTGSVEIEGKLYKINGGTHTPNSFDFGTIASLLTDGKDYLISLVPKYNEPVSRNVAEASTPPLNYTVTLNGSGESLLSYFLPSDTESAVRLLGGYQAIQKRINGGSASTSDVTVYNDYSEQLSRLSDPRFTGQLLPIVGYEFVIAQVYDQDNSGVPNLLNKPGYTEADFNLLKATQGHIPAQRKVMLESEAATLFNTALWKLAFANKYTTNKALALTDINPVSIDLSVATPFSAVGTSYVAVMEYYFPTFMPEGHVGKELGIDLFLTKEDTSLLGRINPIYLENPLQVARTSMAANPRPALTLYGDPVALTRVTAAVSGTTVTLTKVADMFDRLIGN